MGKQTENATILDQDRSGGKGKMPEKLPRLFLYLLGTILLLNLLQSHFTELIFDEAYYWYYAKEMAWGYFDHPPMVALLIKIGSFFFKGELGVRFMSCIQSVGTFLILWSLIDSPKKKDHVIPFFVLVWSMTLFNAYGFFTLPDTPLLFFTALFLWVYKRFVNKPSLWWALLMGLVMAALMYSKYHAVLVILFVLLSNLRLLANKYAWFSVCVALICYVPHINWLYQHDFVSVRYHLSNRPNKAYTFSEFTLGYFLNLLAIFGLTFPWVYLSLIKARQKDLFTRALIFLAYGVIIFFFISSFQKRVQTQWIIAISIPLAILAFNRMLVDENMRKWIVRAGLANIVILLFLRIGLIYEPLFPITYESHGNKKWVAEVSGIAGDRPVVFENSYRLAPMYEFYSGKTSFSLNNAHYRKNQYSIDGSEAKVQHREVIYVSQYLSDKELTFAQFHETRYGTIMPDFESFRKLQCMVEEEQVKEPWEKEQTMKVFNPYDTDIDLKKLKFGATYLNGNKELVEVVPVTYIRPDENIMVLKSNDTAFFTFTLPKPQKTGVKYFRMGISENGLPYGLNGQNIKLK